MSKNCVVTGGSRGIGFAIAQKLASEGNNVAIAARNVERLESAAEELRSEHEDIEVLTYSLDVTAKTELKKFADHLAEKWGAVDVLVNNAGTFTPGSVLTEEEGALENMVETNLYSAYYLTRYLFPQIEKSEGASIFNICSIAALQAYPNGGSYGISKYAMLGWSNNLREELKTRGIKVTAIHPGAVWTDSWAESGVDRQRLMEAEDVAESISSCLRMGSKAVVEQIVIRPQLGDL